MYTADEGRERVAREDAQQVAKLDNERDQDRSGGLKDMNKERTADANPDPITGAPGAHPVGTGVGAASGAAAGAAVGAVVGGPVGMAVGGAVGAVAGGLAGKAAAEGVNPTVEDDYWRANFDSRPYVVKESSYDIYRPAYKYGWEARERHTDKSWNDVETSLSSDWEKARGPSNLTWVDARPAARDAWEHIGT